jgi:hypothetical protein
MNNEGMSDPARRAFVHLLHEVLEGPSPEAAFVLNRGDRGLLASLAALSAEAASARPGGRSSVAAHVDHLRYGFHLLNRWARGESPWHDADYSASWRRQHVDETQWRDLRAALAGEAHDWAEAANQPRDWSQEDWSNALSSVVHLAYHVGAIRQVAEAASGPPAKD